MPRALRTALFTALLLSWGIGAESAPDSTKATQPPAKAAAPAAPAAPPQLPAGSSPAQAAQKAAQKSAQKGPHSKPAVIPVTAPDTATPAKAPSPSLASAESMAPVEVNAAVTASNPQQSAPGSGGSAWQAPLAAAVLMLVIALKRQGSSS